MLDEFFEDSVTTEWLQVAVSKGLSFCVIAGSLVGKLPQVHKIWHAKSADGISILSIWLESVGLGIQLSYNIIRETPLSTFAEVPIIFVQSLVLLVVVAFYSENISKRFCCVMITLISCVVAMSVRLVPIVVTAWIFALNSVLSMCVTVPQLLKNFQTSSTGQLSFVVAAMTLGGTSTRLFTTWMEVEDVALLFNVLINWVLCATLLVQFGRYSPEGKPAKE